MPNVWYHEALEGGHAGASDNRQAAALQAGDQQFLWRTLAGGTAVGRRAARAAPAGVR